MSRIAHFLTNTIQAQKITYLVTNLCQYQCLLVCLTPSTYIQKYRQYFNECVIHAFDNLLIVINNGYHINSQLAQILKCNSHKGDQHKCQV